MPHISPPTSPEHPARQPVEHPGGDELTPTMKLKRRPIAAKYTEVIDSM